MRIVRNTITVKLDQNEKTCLQEAIKIIDAISQNQEIIDGCDDLCPFAKCCDQANYECDRVCLLEQTSDNLNFILEKCQ